MPNLYSLNLLPHHLSHVNVSQALESGKCKYLYRQSSSESMLLPLPDILCKIFLICDFSFLFLDELPSSSPHVPPTNGAGGSPPDTGGQISNPATAPIPPPVPASAPVPTAPSPPSPTLPPHISQPPVSYFIKIHSFCTRRGDNVVNCVSDD